MDVSLDRVLCGCSRKGALGGKLIVGLIFLSADFVDPAPADELFRPVRPDVRLIAAFEFIVYSRSTLGDL
jgi:hypothetical protein